MEYRTRKQIIISTIFFLCLALIGVGVYFVTRPEPTCFDRVINQGEEGIDCGGPCQPCSLLSLEKIETLFIKAIPTKDQNYDLLAKISNPNPNHGSAEVNYQFKLYDLNNKLVTDKSGTTFILPRETKYIVEPKISASGLVSRITFEVSQIKWKEFKDFQRPKIDIFNKDYRILRQEPIFSQTSGIVKNSSPFDFDKVKIIIVLFDKDDGVLAVNLIEVQTLLAGEERYFVAPWFFEFLGDVARIEAEPQTNIFDSENFMRRYQ